MDVPAAIFATLLTTVSLWLAYRWVIKPHREEKKQKSYRIVEKFHRDHWEGWRSKSSDDESPPS